VKRNPKSSKTKFYAKLKLDKELKEVIKFYHEWKRRILGSK